MSVAPSPPVTRERAARVIVGTKDAFTRSPLYHLRLITSGLAELFAARGLVSVLATRQFKTQYSQSALGYGWAIFRPLFQMTIMSFVFSTVLKVPGLPGIPFPLFLFVGLIGWSFFSDGVASGVDSVAGSLGLVNKVYFPREALIIAAVLVKLVDLVLAAAVFGLLMVFFREGVHWSILWVPLIVVLQGFFTVAVALPLAALNVYFRDTRYLVSVGLLAWMYLTPVFYGTDIVPEEYALIFDINPMSVFINAYREVIFVGGNPDIVHLAMGLGVSTAAFVVGYWLFRLMGRGFADAV